MNKSCTTYFLGITGGIGSGKSLVCQVFQLHGASIFSADMVAKNLMETDSVLKEEVIAAFGSEAYTHEGGLNREFLSNKVFGNPEYLHKLNKIVHPRVLTKFREAKVKAQETNVGVLVIEAALIYETGAEKDLDAVIVVDAPADVRVKRVMARDSTSSDQFWMRVNHQFPSMEIRERADYLLENNGDLEELKDKAEALWREVSKGIPPAS